MELIEHLKWRYATKKMDPSKKVSEDHISKVMEAIQLAASSYGLQPYKVIDIKDSELRKQLQPLCWNQSQVVDASHLFVFCNQTEVTDKDVDQFVELKAKTNGLDVNQIKGYGDFVKVKMKEKSADEMYHWTAKQTYVALGNALNACAELKIDSTPMEGFEKDKVNNILDLPSKGLNACVLLTIGYRSDEDASQHSKKVRKPMDVLFIER